MVFATQQAPSKNGFLHVAVGALINPGGEVLITRRPEHVHQGGLWEFPGGKVELGENVEAALTRELREELGTDVASMRPLIRVHHAYTDKTVLLDVWRIDRYHGEPRGLEGQPLRWVTPQALAEYDFPAADVPIINALRLPTEYAITSEPGDQLKVFLRHLENVLTRGIRLIQLRAKYLSEDDLLTLYQTAQRLTKPYGARLLLNGSPAQARALDVDGLHLTTAQLMVLDTRPLPADRWVAASCHNLEELRQASRIGVDFAVVSPVRTTPSHPDVQPLGWQGLQALTEMAALPIYALGGMTMADVDQAWHHGGQGIAAVRALWV
jgi:8-oxo-dGTP diphosphatase